MSKDELVRLAEDFFLKGCHGTMANHGLFAQLKRINEGRVGGLTARLHEQMMGLRMALMITRD